MVFTGQKLVMVNKFQVLRFQLGTVLTAQYNVSTFEASMISGYQTPSATGCVDSDKCSSQCLAEFSEGDAAVHISEDLIHSNFLYSSEAERS